MCTKAYYYCTIKKFNVTMSTNETSRRNKILDYLLTCKKFSRIPNSLFLRTIYRMNYNNLCQSIDSKFGIEKKISKPL